MNYIKVLLLVIISICATSVLYAQVNGTGSIVVLVASTPVSLPTPTPTPTSTPTAGCPVGFTCGSPFSSSASGTLTSYGAGSQPSLPTLKANPIIFTPTGGGVDNTSALRTALTNAHNAGTDVLVANFSGTVTISGQIIPWPGNVMMQCTNINTTFFSPTVNSNNGPPMFEFCNGTNGGVNCNNSPGPSDGGSSSSPSGISNCTLMGANTVGPSGYPGCATGTPSNPGSCPQGQDWLVLSEHSSNLAFIGNVWRNTNGQCADENICGSNGPSGCSNVNVSYNSAYNCALYSFCGDNVANATTDHNYNFDCRLGNEMDSANPVQVTTGDLSFNYDQRDRFGVGQTCVYEGNCLLGINNDLFGAINGNGSGITVNHNVLDATSSGGGLSVTNSNGTNNNNGKFSNNTCVNGATGC